MIETDVILADIIATDMSLPDSRVVVYNQNFKPPKDDAIFIIISLQGSKTIGVNNRFIPADSEGNDREEKYISIQETFNVEITSRDRSALERYPEVLTALISDYSVQAQESNQIKIFRGGQPVDLSFIEGGSSLHRYRIPVIINSTKVYEKDITTYDKYQTPQEVIE